MEADRKRGNERVHEADGQERRKNYSFPDHREPRIRHYDVMGQLP